MYLRYEGNADSSVRLDELQQHLCANFAEQIFNVISYEGIVHYRLSVTLHAPTSTRTTTIEDN